MRWLKGAWTQTMLRHHGAYLIQFGGQISWPSWECCYSSWPWGVCERAHPRTRHQWLLRCTKLRLFISFHTAFRMASSTMFNWSRFHRSLLFGGCTLQLQASFNETVWNPTEEPWTYLEPSRIKRSQFLTCVQGNFVQVCGIQPVIHTSSLSPQWFIMFCLRTRCERRWRTKCANGLAQTVGCGAEKKHDRERRK
jgi:hypothetical protein